jgi:hypothetical protein
MTPADLEQFGQAIALIAKASFVGAIVAGFLGSSIGNLVGQVLEWALMQVPRWRQWQRTRNRMNRLEYAELLRRRRESIERAVQQ